MRKYCEECGREVETKVITKRESYDVCGESIEVDAQILVCAECGEEFYCEELDNATLIRAYNEYRTPRLQRTGSVSDFQKVPVVHCRNPAEPEP